MHLFCHMEAPSTSWFTHVGSITLILAQLPQYLLHTSGQSQVSHLESIPPKLYSTCLERRYPPSHLVLLITSLENFCFINKLFYLCSSCKIDLKWGVILTLGKYYAMSSNTFCCHRVGLGELPLHLVGRGKLLSC